VIQYRRDIFTTLQDIQRLADIPTKVPVFFGLLSRTDPDVVHRKERLEVMVQDQKTRLVSFNSGSENPNLIKLKLPLPCVAIDNCTQAACDISDKDIFDYYVGRHSGRICQTHSIEMECLNNKQPDRLAKGLDSISTQQDECKSET